MPDPRRLDGDPSPAPTPPDAGFGPAYLAALGVVAVSFGLGLVTAGLFLRGPGGRAVVLGGAAILLLGFMALGFAAWQVRHRPPGGEDRRSPGRDGRSH